MASGDWIKDLLQTSVYEGAGRKRKVSFDRVFEVALLNGGDESVERMREMRQLGDLTAGQAVMILSNLLRGAARKNRGVKTLDHKGKVRTVDAPPEWLRHYGIAA
jgi:hypothetical protein